MPPPPEVTYHRHKAGHGGKLRLPDLRFCSSTTSITRSGPRWRLLRTISLVAGRRSSSYTAKHPPHGCQTRDVAPALAVQNGLTRAVAPDGRHGVSRIAEERDSAERPAPQRIAIAVGILVESEGRFDQRDGIDPIKTKPVANKLHCSAYTIIAAAISRKRRSSRLHAASSQIGALKFRRPPMRLGQPHPILFAAGDEGVAVTFPLDLLRCRRGIETDGHRRGAYRHIDLPPLLCLRGGSASRSASGR